MSEPKLEPCPFCGSQVILIIPDSISTTVACSQCDAGVSSFGEDQLAKATAAWNRRALPRRQSMVECLEAAMIANYPDIPLRELTQSVESKLLHDTVDSFSCTTLALALQIACGEGDEGG
jgi:Lar family restriction alleviation protein